MGKQCFTLFLLYQLTFQENTLSIKTSLQVINNINLWHLIHSHNNRMFCDVNPTYEVNQLKKMRFHILVKFYQ